MAFFASICLLPACGTEIGNGKKTPTPPTAESGSPDATRSPVADNTNTVATGTSTSPTVTSSETLAIYHLFEACASPFSEISASSFADALGSVPLTVTKPTSTSWTVAYASQTTAFSSATTASYPYAIQSTTATLGTLTCTGTTLQTSATESVRTTTFSDGYKTAWTLDLHSTVTTLIVTDGSGTVVGKWTVR
ncbi:MAG: hypothetical protein H7249_04795 [Chitinophagaceae bacterium]|nr:hypothetical protein [Oligoflexus sp.]